MTPIGKYIVIANIDEEVTTKSGLLLSGEDVKGMRYRKAEVIAAGTDVASIKKSDVIYYDKSHGFTMLIEDVPYTIIQENHVVVVL